MPPKFLPNRLRKLLLCSLLLTVVFTAAIGQNPIPAENLLPGTPKSTWDSPDGDDIHGFATEISVNKGETVNFKININSPTLVPYTVEIYRIGYYQGLGARFITDLGPSLTGKSQPIYDYQTATGKVDCSNWAVSTSWAVPANAVSGVYIARLACSAVNSSGLVFFIVRDDAANSPLLVKTSDATWQAYNYYGGNTFYSANTPVPGYTRAVKISYQRPIHVRSNFSNFFNAELPMIMWLERNGYNVSYTTDWDLSRNSTPITPSNHKVIMSSGHDEYWSTEERNKLETARNNGVHLAFFSGNTSYWKTRWEDNYQTLVCYKEGTTGIYACGSKCDPVPNVWTGAWRDGCLPAYGSADGCRNEGSFLGQMGWNESMGSIEIPYTHKNLRFWKNTTVPGIGVGQTAAMPLGTLGREWDQEQFVETFPPHRIPLSFTTLNGLTHSMALFRHDPSGALIFSSGSLQWSWGLEALHDNLSGPASLDVQQATTNLLFDMSLTAATPQAGIIAPTPSTDVQAPTTTIVTPVHNASVPGSPITISGTSADNGGGAVGGVEVSIDNGTTWHHAAGFENWSYTFSPTGYGNINIKVRAWDDRFNLETPGASGSSNSISITLTGPFTYTVFNASYPAGTPDFFHVAGDIELGMKFKSTIPGFITGFRYYKGASVDGQHIGHLWSSNGTLLATEPFVSETASGWQSVQLSTPVAISANTTYVVSYFTASGKYSYTDPFFTSAIVNGPLRGLANGEDGGNGVIFYPGSGFPTGNGTSTNYYADVIFTSSDVTPPQVLSVTPVNNATSVSVSVHPTATFDEALDPGTVTTLTAIIEGPGNVIIPASVSLNSTVITLTPSSALAPNTTYTVTLKGGSIEPVIKDLSGNALAVDYTWSFTTQSGQAPIVTLDPVSQTTCPNIVISFTSAANGIPSPTVQWQVSTDNGNTWNDIAGETNPTYTFTEVLANNGNQYRAVWTNPFGVVNSNPAILTVNPNANAGTVTGSSPLCIGQTTTYTSNGDPGGIWSTSDAGVATVNPSTGLVVAIGGGTATITYTVCSGVATANVTVTPNANPGTITGNSPLCIGVTNTYTSNGDAGGTWTSTNTGVATVDPSTGLVTAVAAGTTDIKYTVITPGCNTPVTATKTLTINPSANAGTVSGQGRLCVGSTATYTTNGDTGGTWTSTNPPVATIDPVTGVVTAVSEGFADFIYTVNTGCFSPVQSFYTIEVTTSISAGTVTGTSPMCSGTTATYTSNGVIGGVWSSTNTGVATVNSATGLVTAVAAGTSDITYTLIGCGNVPVSAFQTLIVNQGAVAGTVTGISPLCIGATATYTTDGDAGGTWASTNTAVATVDPSTGLVTALADGITDITYTVITCTGPSTVFQVLTVNPSVNPGTVTGTSPLCIGATTTYTSNGDAGGTWTSTNTGIATVDPSSGLVTAIGSGTTTITYTVAGCNGVASANLTVSLNANAGTITGTTPLCIGVTDTYTSNGDAGGTWTSTNPAVATVDPSTGLVTAIAAGTTNITYTVNAGCNNPASSFLTLTVDPTANAGVVSGQGRLCVGTTATYTSNGDAGGTWSSLAPAVATIDPVTGVVTAISEGFADFIYTVNTGCFAPVQAFYTIEVTTSITAGTVTGTSPLCIGATATYTSTGIIGGVWSSTNTAVATVNPATGLVTGIAPGTSDITYTLIGCGNVPVTAFQTVTVNPNASVGTITGTSPLCIGATATYTSNGDAGGTWSSTNPAVASVNPTTGLVTALAAGTTDITYTVNACNGTASGFQTLTVDPSANPGTVTGTSPLCIGATATYTSNGDAGGTWSSTNAAVATVDPSTGLVTATGAGTTTITYTVAGCNGAAGASLTVSPSATAGTISGTSALCIGVTDTYTSNGDAGGTWSSTNPAVATVNPATGEVTTITAGTTDITYTVNTGCNNPASSFKTLTVNPNANAGTVTGQGRLCVGSTAPYFSSGDPGGTWTSSTPSVATIDPVTGIVTAIAAGFADFIYSVNTGCFAPVQSFYTIEVEASTNPNSGIISGTTPLCIGATATYTSSGDVGGAWSSTNTAVATVNPSTGLVTAIGVGTSNITYTLIGCGNTPVSSIRTVTVNPNANAGTVSGTSPLCIGATATYSSDGMVTGSWTSTNPAVATVNLTTGLVTAVSAGTTDITYTVNGCNGPSIAIKTLTVSPNVNAGTVSGTSPLCIGATATYTSNGDAGGAWTSTNTGVATVDPSTGLVTGITTGTTDITYTVNGCAGPQSAFQALTVNPNANAGTVTGTSSLCIGSTATYSSNGDAGGTWSSTNMAVATVDPSTGLVTALTAGTTDITYTVNSGCNNPFSSFQTLTVTPNANAGTVSGTSPLCLAATTTYTSDGDAGGTWTSTNPAVATVDPSTGLVTVLTTGTTDITYTVNGCNGPSAAFKTLTVNANVNAGTVTGTSPLCIGATATYTSNGDVGGTWSSTNTAVATVDPSTGLVTAIAAGTSDITYTVNGCPTPQSAFQTLTVNPNANPGTITGTSPLCIGATTTYTTNGDGGGAWASTNTGVATVDPSTGLVTAIAAGLTNITYTVNAGCNNPQTSSASLTVSQNANAGNVIGPSALCLLSTANYTTDGDLGGTWSSSNILVATITPGGFATGLLPGTADFTYTVNAGCGSPVSVTKTVTVSLAPDAGIVTGTSPLCIGATTTYSSDGNPGGTWSSTNAGVATVDPSTGLVTAIGAGTTDITYTTSGLCLGSASAFKTLTVIANANPGTVTGATGLCAGNTTLYTSNGEAGGTWHSTNTSVATVDATGLVTTIAPGTSDITYTVNTGCNAPLSAFQTITVTAYSSTLAGVAGGPQVCRTLSVQPGGTSYSDGSCNLIATIIPSGAFAVSGNINTCVIIEDAVHTYNSVPYVQRKYDIVPASNAATSTATITLYFTQDEFDAFNISRGIYPPLPAGNGDLAGIANLLVTQFHGTGTNPGDYTGISELIDPNNGNIVWNNTMNRWEITFDVNGFSGFYVHTSLNNTPLPITLLSFNGRNNGIYNLLEWATTTEQNSSHFEVLRSTDGVNFETAGVVTAAGNSSVTRNYTFNDNIAAIDKDLYYYRLKMVDNNGNIKYSAIVKIRLSSKGFMVEASPNPFTSYIRLNVETALQENATISLTDASGRRIQQQQSMLRKGNNAIMLNNFSNLPSGVYLLTITTDTQQQTLRVIKQQ